MSIAVHKEIGYDIMQYLCDVFPGSKLIDINEHDCYQKLFLDNGCSIHYTKWRDSKMPFYIILYNEKGKLIFELDLSMLLYDKEQFQWHLKKPQNKKTLSVLQDKLGNQLALPDDYINLIKYQKKELDSGKNTPKNGFYFLFNVIWDELTERLLDLIISVFEVHDIEVSSIEPKEADDDREEFVNQSRRVRRGQRKLRLKLLELYSCKCAITGYAPTEVLEVAHIISHAASGVNHSENGLLLRADIHSLFDSNLLRIKPENFEVVIDISLKSTPYWDMNGKKLRKRIDGNTPSKSFLERRWLGERT